MSNIILTKKRLAALVKEEVQKFLLEENSNRDELRTLISKAIVQMEEHSVLIQEAGHVLSSEEMGPETIMSVLKAQTAYVQQLQKLLESLR